MRMSVALAKSAEDDEPAGRPQAQDAKESGACSPDTADGCSSKDPAAIPVLTQDTPQDVDPDGAFELHEIMYGPGGVTQFDSDEIDAMIASRQL